MKKFIEFTIFKTELRLIVDYDQILTLKETTEFSCSLMLSTGLSYELSGDYESNKNLILNIKE